MTDPLPRPDIPPEGGPPLRDVAPVDADEFEGSFGESLAATLDLSTWQDRSDYGAIYERLAGEVADAVERERRVDDFVRQRVFPALRNPVIPHAGVYQATVADLENAHRTVLFNGGLEACDGTVVTHDTLVLTITQIGICLVSYQGQEMSLSQRLFRRDLRTSIADPASEALAVLQRRQDRSAVGVEDRRETLSELARRGIMTYAERAVLLHKSSAPWRMGHGNPVPYELLTGSGSMDLLAAAVDVMTDFIIGQPRFVFVPSTIRDRVLLTIGNALHPLEYAVIETMEDRLMRIVEGGHYERSADHNWARVAADFVREVGPNILLGVFRASRTAPPYAFFAHKEFVHQAAVIAMADASLQEHRGFPLLIDIADSLCRARFGADTFGEAVRTAYLDADEPYRYLAERETR